MSVIFFTNKVNKDHLDVLSKLAKFLEHEVKVLTIPQHRPEDHITDSGIVVSFGRLASSLVEQTIQDKKMSRVQHTSLVHPEYLLPLTKNTKPRTEVHATFTKLKEVIAEERFNPQRVVVTAEDLPKLSAIQVLLLKKLTAEEGKTSCFQTTKGGKLIEISEEPLDNSNADIHLTFTEVYTVRSIMDVLGVSEVEFVSTEENNSPGTTR